MGNSVQHELILSSRFTFYRRIFSSAYIMQADALATWRDLLSNQNTIDTVLFRVLSDVVDKGITDSDRSELERMRLVLLRQKAECRRFLSRVTTLVNETGSAKLIKVTLIET